MTAPVPRSRVALGAALLAAALAGVVGVTEWLRHPPPVTPVTAEAAAGDPREPTPPCPDARTGSVPDEAQQVGSDDLFDCPRSYEGAAVAYEGEVVGALMPRRGGVWTQLNDDVYAGELGPLPAHRAFRGGNAGVGVLLPHDLAEEVQHVGGPVTRGDVLRVVGTFHRSDPASGEVGVLRAVDGEITRRGAPIEHDVLPERRVLGLLLGMSAIAAVTTGRRRRRW